MFENHSIILKKQLDLIKFGYKFMSGIQDVTEDFYLRLFASIDITPEAGKKLIMEWNKAFRKMRKEMAEKNIDAYTTLCLKCIEK